MSSMATPLHRKLGLKPGSDLGLIGAPAGWSVRDLPEAVAVHRGARPPVQPAEVMVAFVRAQAELVRLLPALTESLAADASLWIAWPRRAGGHTSDITDTSLRDAVLPTGLVDTKVAALDDDWSGLKFVWRTELRGDVRRRRSS
jgi:hypothetical protein